MTKLTIIGAGSMSEAFLSGINKSSFIFGDNIMVTNRSIEVRLQELQTKYGIKYSYNLQSLMSDADAIILAMKPKDVKASLKRIKEFVPENTLLISILAGVSIKSIEKLLDKKIPIARAMPNTSATIGKSATGVALNKCEGTSKTFGTKNI